MNDSLRLREKTVSLLLAGQFAGDDPCLSHNLRRTIFVFVFPACTFLRTQFRISARLKLHGVRRVYLPNHIDRPNENRVGSRLNFDFDYIRFDRAVLLPPKGLHFNIFN